MTELKPQFLRLANVGILEFCLNHPGHVMASRILESFENLSEEAIQRAYEVHEGKLYPAVEEFIRYEFVRGEKPKNVVSESSKAFLREPAWLKAGEDGSPTAG